MKVATIAALAVTAALGCHPRWPHIGGDRQECAGLACAPSLPRGADQIAYFVVDTRPPDEPVALTDGTLVATAGILAPASVPLERCRLRVRWKGTSRGEVTTPIRAVEGQGEVRSATWQVDVPGFAGDEILEVWRDLECPDGLTITPGPNVDHVAAEAGRERFCRRGAAWSPGSIDLATEVEQLVLTPPAGVVVGRDGTALVDECTHVVLLELAPLGADPDRDVGLTVELPPRRARDEAMFVQLFAGGADGPTVRIHLARRMPAAAVRAALAGHRFATVWGGVIERPDEP